MTAEVSLCSFFRFTVYYYIAIHIIAWVVHSR
jgi:hypothetical protein